jgi:hypothetical protein
MTIVQMLRLLIIVQFNNLYFQPIKNCVCYENIMICIVAKWISWSKIVQDQVVVYLQNQKEEHRS